MAASARHPRLAQSDARIDKERGMRCKRLRRYIERLKALQGQSLTRDQLLMKLGAAKHDAGRAAGLVKVTWPKEASCTASLEFSLDRQRLRQVRRREGRYLQVTLMAKLRTLAGGTTPREVIAKFKTMQMMDVHLPTTDGRELTLSRNTQPEAEHRILLNQLRLGLPSQPPPKITIAQARQATAELVL